MRKRVMTVTLEVEVPTTTSENEVGTAINAALDEPPCDWGEWTVGAATITAVRIEESDDESD